MSVLRNRVQSIHQKLSRQLHKNESTTGSKAKYVYGQPTANTHPHLLKADEVIPCIQRKELQNRRHNLVKSIKQQVANTNKDISAHLIIVPSAVKKYMSEKIPYVFRQNSDYLYLSGCMEPDSCIIINTAQASTDHRTTLFVRNPDSHSEMWDGPRTNTETAPNLFGVEQSLPMGDLQSYVHSYLKSNKNCAVWYDYMDIIQPSVNNIMCDFLKEKSRCYNPKAFIHKLRLIKSPAEIQLMRESCKIASEAFISTMTVSHPGINEHEIFAKVDYECRKRGAEYLAYPPVVAGGARATTIHYVNNNQKVHSGEMVLMDAGCEYHGYSSDITRTWPVNGTFTPEQRLLYEIIYSVQSDLLNLLHGFPTLDSLFDSMCMQLGKGLQEIGLISKTASSEYLFKAAYRFCPHHVSHYLGMDVHDTASIPRNIRLQPGMVITVEPGIYINDKHDVPKHFKGLGVRIEDDVLITKNGPELLTKYCPRDLEDIQHIASQNL